MLGALALSITTPAFAAWEARDIIDPMTDAKRPIRVLTNDSGDALIIKCDQPGKNQVYVHLISRQYLGGIRRSYRHLFYRFDEQEPVRDNWSYHAREALAIQGQVDVGRFLSGLAGARKLAIRATTYEMGQVDMTFDATGAEQRIREVYAGCQDEMPIMP